MFDLFEVIVRGLEATPPADPVVHGPQLEDLTVVSSGLIQDRRGWYRVQRDVRIARGLDALEDVMVRIQRGRALQGHLQTRWRAQEAPILAARRRRERLLGPLSYLRPATHGAQP